MLSGRASRRRRTSNPDIISSEWVYPNFVDPPVSNRFELNAHPSRYLETLYRSMHNMPPIVGQQYQYSNRESIYRSSCNHGEHDSYPSSVSSGFPHSPISPNQDITGYKRTLVLSKLPRDWVEYLFNTLYSKNKKMIRRFLKRYIISAPYKSTFTAEDDKQSRKTLLELFNKIDDRPSNIETMFYDRWYSTVFGQCYDPEDECEAVTNNYDNLFLDVDYVNIDIKDNVRYTRKGNIIKDGVVKPANKAEKLRNRNPELSVSPNKNIIFNQRRRTQRLNAIKLRKKQDMQEADNGEVYDGGAAFAKGGFGCVFKPALNCKKSELNSKPNYVSKLIDSKHAKREYTYIYKIKKKLDHLPPNIKKYFLLDNVSVCDPGPLSESDKVKIEEVCDYILTRVIDDVTQEPINSKNINNNLDKFKIINMPELSISLSNYIRKTDLTPFDLINLNNNIIEYLTIVIPVLYKNGVVHGDIKPDNLMFNMSDNNTLVLIDWGLSYTLDDERKNVPEALQTLATQWHHPFSSFLFKKHVMKKYEDLLEKFKKDGVKLTRENLREFALSEYNNFISKHEKQYLFLVETFTNVYGEELEKKIKSLGYYDVNSYISNLVINYIIEYIIDILIAYTVNYKLEIGRYFYEVYLLNADTFGIMSTYNDLIETIPLMTKLTSVEKKMINAKLINMLTQNLYRNGDKVVNIPKLVNDIKQLNKYLMNISVKSRKKEAYGNMDRRVLNLKKSMVDKGLNENKITIGKIEKYSSRRGRSTKRQSHIEIPVVMGGYNNNNKKSRKTMKTGKK
jgi:hypothetical protein